MKKSRPLLLRRKTLLIVGLIIVVVIAALEITNTTYLFHKKKVPQTIPATVQKDAKQQKKDTKGTSKQHGSSPAQSTTTEQPDKVASSGGGTAGAPLVQPFGSFVSNHFPGQNGSNTKEQSVCNTTPGATCYIQFTNTSSGKVTKLPQQTVDNNGSAVWAWDANTLTSGKWQITAIANLNGQTKSATDSISLEIQ